MTVFDMTFGIVVVVCLAKVLMAFARRGERRTDPRLEERLHRMEGLEERVRVLEQIVTDRRYDLSAQIDELEKAR